MNTIKQRRTRQGLNKGAWSGEAMAHDQGKQLGVAKERKGRGQGNNWAWPGEIRMWDKRSTWQTPTETEPCAQTQNKH